MISTLLHLQAWPQSTERDLLSQMRFWTVTQWLRWRPQWSNYLMSWENLQFFSAEFQRIDGVKKHLFLGIKRQCQVVRWHFGDLGGKSSLPAFKFVFFFALAPLVFLGVEEAQASWIINRSFPALFHVLGWAIKPCHARVGAQHLGRPHWEV